MAKRTGDVQAKEELPAAVADFICLLAWGLRYAEGTEATVAMYAVRALDAEQRRATRAKVLKTLQRAQTHEVVRRVWAEHMNAAELTFEGDVIGFLRRMAERIE